MFTLPEPVPQSVLLPSSYAAQLLGTTEQSLANWRQRGLGPDYTSVDGQIYYRLDNLESWALESSVTEFLETIDRIIAVQPRRWRQAAEPKPSPYIFVKPPPTLPEPGPLEEPVGRARGGHARWAGMTAEERSDAARKASWKRWSEEH